MWKLITVVIAKFLIVFLRLLGRHATALPGLVAERLHPRLLAKMMKTVPGGTIMVTGTNGKTTTAKILRKVLRAQGLKVLSNPSGSNFTRGILASIIDHASWLGRLNYDIAVLEVDEAYTPLVAAEIKPRTIVVLNVMRDQLDRYGEIDNTVSMIGRALKHSSGLVFNADDTPLEVLPQFVKNTTAFAAAESINKLLPSDAELHAEQPPKTTTKHKADVILVGYQQQDDETTLKVQINNKNLEVKTRLEGVHNYLNVTAALATVQHMFEGIDQPAVEAISRIRPAFGRGEKIVIGGVIVHLALVKNPSGFNQNVRSYVSDSVGAILFIVNDRIADGRDVSWLWDVDLSPVVKQSKIKVMCAGTRAYDMSLRLQHEGLHADIIETKINRVLARSIEQVPNDKELLILPTYTAMLETRKLLLKMQKGPES